MKYRQCPDEDRVTSDQSLKLLFNRSLEQGKISTKWKNTKVNLIQEKEITQIFKTIIQ